MGQTFKQDSRAKESRLNGKTVLLDGLLFYAAGSDGVIRRGNGEGLRGAVPRTLAELFRGFESELDERDASEIPPEAERALEALG